MLDKAKIVATAVLAFACASVAPADGAALYLSHDYGELISRGPVIAHISTQDGRHGCRPDIQVQRHGRTVSIHANRLPAGAPDEFCVDGPSVSLGELEDGWWNVELQFYEADGRTLADRATIEARVRRPGISCNPYPWFTPTLMVLHKSIPGYEIVRRIETEPAFAAMLGGPVSAAHGRIGNFEYAWLHYPMLANANEKRALLEATGQFNSVAANGPLCFSARLSPPAADHWGRVIEFYHEALGHYFYTAHPAEIAGLENGSGARGWMRTGKSFAVLLNPGCPLGRPEQAAYRFFGKPGVGPNSHVFTVDREECRSVDTTGLWVYEGVPFWASPTDSKGGCSRATEIPLHRLWRPFGDSTHRFTVEPAVIDEMTAKGWIHEGIAMCVLKE